jgi:hypothetical protein
MDWNPGAGQLPLGAWGAVALYLLTAYLCWRVARVLRPFGAVRRSEARVWIAIAVLFLVLGICREFDIQSAITDYWRSVARHQGWYGDRRSFQPVIILAIGMGFLIALVMLGKALPNLSPITQLAVMGAIMLLAYIAVRAVSLHDVDVLAGMTVLGLRLGWIMEFSGIFMVILAARRRHARIAARIAGIAATSSGRWDRLGENFTGRRPPATTWPASPDPKEAQHGHADHPQDPAPRRPR